MTGNYIGEEGIRQKTEIKTRENRKVDTLGRTERASP